MKNNFIDAEPENIKELKEFAEDKKNTRNRIFAINELGKYRCKESISILYRLMCRDLVFDVKEKSFRKLQAFGENVKLPKKKMGNLISGIDKKIEKVIEKLNEPTLYSDFKILFKEKYPIPYDVYENDKKVGFDKWLKNIIKSLPKYNSSKIILDDIPREYKEKDVQKNLETDKNKKVNKKEMNFIGTIKDEIIIVDRLIKSAVLKNILEIIKINEVRNFEKGTKINFTYPITIVVGENGVGKSTLFKLIKSIGYNQEPNDYLISTVLDESDNGKNMEFEYTLNNKKYIYTKRKEWELKEIDEISNQMKDSNKQRIRIEDIEFKSYLGSYDKNIYFDNIGKTLNRKQKNEYSQRVARKINQAMKNNVDQRRRKGTKYLSESEIKSINYILNKNYNEIIVIEHKYYNGSWGTTIVFKEDINYSEANSGSGEFNVAKLISKVSEIQSNSLLILDEPEISLHPGAQKRLLRYLLKVIIDKKIQIIISTHSPLFIEEMPREAIKILEFTGNRTVEILENIGQLEAFKSIQYEFDKINIIVEDSLAKKIIDRIAKEENKQEYINVQFHPGGASSIKTHLITAFSKVKDTQKFFLFDGDMKFQAVKDFTIIPEKELSLEFYSNEFKAVTGIKADTVQWCTDGKNGQPNIEQKKELIKEYLNYYKKNVFFLPEKIPEDIIFSEEYLKKAFDYVDAKLILENTNNKDKFYSLKNIAEIVSIDVLYESFLNYFIKTQKSTGNYKQIKSCIEEIISKSENS